MSLELNGVPQSSSNPPAVQVVSATALPLPTGASTEATLQAIKGLLQTQVSVAELFVYDTTTSNPVRFYVRRELESETGTPTVQFLNLDGSVPGTAPTASNLAPATAAGSGGGLAVETATYDVVTAFTGAAVGDILVRTLFEASAGGAPTSAWYNATQGTLLASAPSSANVVEFSKAVQAAVTALAGALADGADVTQGTKADVAASSPGTAAPWSVVALLKAVWTNVAATVAALGTTADVPLNAPASATPTSVIGLLKGMFNLQIGGTARITQATYYAEVSHTAVAANSTTNGTARAPNNSFGYFTAQVICTSAGTLIINNGYFIESAPVPANTVTRLKVPAFGGGFLVQFTCGGTGGTLDMTTGFTAA